MVGIVQTPADSDKPADAANPGQSLRRTSRVRKEPYKYRMALAELAPASTNRAGRSPGVGRQSNAATAAISATSAAVVTLRSSPACVGPASSDSLVCSGIRYTVGDIVQLRDSRSSIAYYAQLRSLMQDQYLNSYCVLTWLLPTTAAPPDGSFDPTSYLPGPDEDAPRPLETVQFVCSSPTAVNRLAAPSMEAVSLTAASAMCLGYVQVADDSGGYNWTIAKFPRAPAARISFAADRAAAVAAAVAASNAGASGRMPTVFKDEPQK